MVSVSTKKRLDDLFKHNVRTVLVASGGIWHVAMVIGDYIQHWPTGEVFMLGAIVHTESKK